MTNLSSLCLADKATATPFCISIAPQSKTLDVCMSGCSVFAGIALDFADIDHCIDNGLEEMANRFSLEVVARLVQSAVYLLLSNRAKTYFGRDNFAE